MKKNIHNSIHSDYRKEKSDSLILQSCYNPSLTPFGVANHKAPVKGRVKYDFCPKRCVHQSLAILSNITQKKIF